MVKGKDNIMAFNYDVNNAVIDKKASNCLLASHTLISITNLFITTFLVAHIYSFNGNTFDYLFNVGVYNLFLYLGIGLFYIPLAKLVDHTNRIVIYRISLFVKAALVVFFIFFGEDLSKLLILSGLLNGFGSSIYFASYNVLRQEMVSRKAMASYSSYTYIFAKLVDVTCPILLGLLIDVTTFSQTAIVVFAICIIQIIISFGVKAQKPEKSKYNLKNYLKLRKTNPLVKSKTGIMYFICSIYGASLLVTNLINVCIMIEYNSTFSLGILTSVFSVFAIVAIYLINKYTKAGNRTWLFILCSILEFASIIIFVVKICPATIIILNAVISVTSIVYKVIFDTHRNGILKEAGMYSEIAEHQTVVEILASLSRTIFFGVLLLIALTQSIVVFKIFMVMSVLVTSSVLITLCLYENKYCKINKNKI